MLPLQRPLLPIYASILRNDVVLPAPLEPPSDECPNKLFRQYKKTCWFSAAFNALFLTREVLDMVRASRRGKLTTKDVRAARELMKDPSYCPVATHPSSVWYLNTYINAIVFGIIPKKPDASIIRYITDTDKGGHAFNALSSILPHICGQKYHYAITTSFLSIPTVRTDILIVGSINGVTLKDGITPGNIHRTLTLSGYNLVYRLISSVLTFRYFNSYNEMKVHSIAAYICNEIEYIYDSHFDEPIETEWTKKRFNNYEERKTNLGYTDIKLLRIDFLAFVPKH